MARLDLTSNQFHHTGDAAMLLVTALLLFFCLLEERPFAGFSADETAFLRASKSWLQINRLSCVSSSLWLSISNLAESILVSAIVYSSFSGCVTGLRT